MKRSEVAKMLRDEIAGAIEEKKLPEGEYTVRCKTDKIVIFANVRGFPEYEQKGRYRRFNDASRDLDTKLESMLTAHQQIDPATNELNFRARVEWVGAEDKDVRGS